MLPIKSSLLSECKCLIQELTAQLTQVARQKQELEGRLSGQTSEIERLKNQIEQISVKQQLAFEEWQSSKVVHATDLRQRDNLIERERLEAARVLQQLNSLRGVVPSIENQTETIRKHYKELKQAFMVLQKENMILRRKVAAAEQQNREGAIHLKKIGKSIQRHIDQDQNTQREIKMVHIASQVTQKKRMSRVRVAEMFEKKVSDSEDSQIEVKAQRVTEQPKVPQSRANPELEEQLQSIKGLISKQCLRMEFKNQNILQTNVSKTLEKIDMKLKKLSKMAVDTS